MGREPTDITDRFGSAAETAWRDAYWTLQPHTRKIRQLVIPAILFATLAGMLSFVMYAQQQENRWRNRMRALYAPYEQAVQELDRLSYCPTSLCTERRETYETQKSEAWRRLCTADKDREYIQRVINDGAPHQPCD